jgi:DNA mismatch repair protein MutS2
VDRRVFDLDNLAFFDFINALSRTFASLFAKQELILLRPAESIEASAAFQLELSAAFELLERSSASPIKNDADFFEIYLKLKKSDKPTLTAKEYLVVTDFLCNAAQLRTFVDSKKGSPLLSKMAESIPLNHPLAERIKEVFDKDGHILDAASPALKEIREGIIRSRQRAVHLLKNLFNLPTADKFLQEKNLVERSLRYTIPCKTNFSQYIEGIIHDRSSSGATLFVEPAACVKLNNDLQENLLAEKFEILNIMNSLSDALLAALPEIDRGVEGYSKLALRLETAQFYRCYDWVFPSFGGELNLKGVHHPLLIINKGAGSVPIDISLASKERLIVVSGPNTAGKTVSLKSVGLNHLIAMCGLPIFAKKADMIFFSSIHSDIGDKQSLNMDLSTFSAHMSNIKEILQTLDDAPLILLDELGTGTDPKEGAALALGILEYLRKTNAYIMLTTHFSELKSYALSNEGAKLYSVRFDYENFSPKYELIEGVAGFSEPIMIAKQLGFPEEIIKTAESNMRTFKTALEYNLEELSLLKAEAVHKNREIEQRLAAISAKEVEIERQNAILSERLAKREEELLEESFALLSRSKRLAEEKIKARAADIQEDMLKTAARIDELKAQKKPIEDVKAGDIVFLEKFGKTAKIIEKKDKNVLVELGGIRVTIAANELFGYKTSAALNTPPPKLHGVGNGANKREGKSERSAAMELILVGKRVEEALDILDRYIDDAQYANFEKVYIIHGRGTGQLRRGVQEFLRTCGRVKGFSTASAEDGGDAVTVVDL